MAPPKMVIISFTLSAAFWKSDSSNSRHLVALGPFNSLSYTQSVATLKLANFSTLAPILDISIAKLEFALTVFVNGELVIKPES